MHVRKGNDAAQIERILTENERVKVTRTGYTVKLETDSRIYFFGGPNFGRDAFGAAARIRREAMQVHETAPDGTDLWNGHRGRNPNLVKYFRFSEDEMPREAVCVDISAAYPSALAGLGIIAETGYKALLKLKKEARLKATGMMATTRYIDELHAGKIISRKVEKEPTSSAFFTACHHVGEVLDSAAHMAGDSLAFYWVDGIFCRPESEKTVREVIEAHGFSVTTERVKNMHRSKSGKFIFYEKGGKKTYICPPRRVEIDADEIYKGIAKALEIC